MVFFVENTEGPLQPKILFIHIGKEDFFIQNK
jgi:hypothetical protein